MDIRYGRHPVIRFYSVMRSLHLLDGVGKLPMWTGPQASDRSEVILK